MNQIQPYTFPDTAQQVRVVLIDDEPWFVATDVCAVLGLGNARQAVAQLDDDEVRQEPVTTNDGSSRILQTNLISEPGLYSLVLRSRKAEAKEFKRWLTHEVLPAIRKTGMYGQLERRLSRRELAEYWVEAERKLELAERRAAELEPKAEYVDNFVNADTDSAILRVVANQLHVGEQWLREFLINRKVIYRRVVGSRWSHSKGRHITEYVYLPHAKHKPWFQVADQPEAPRLHNGQIRTTLYVTPVGKVALGRLIQQHQQHQQSA